MASFLSNTIGNVVRSTKNALGLGGVNILPGDVSKTLTGIPAPTSYAGASSGLRPSSANNNLSQVLSNYTIGGPASNTLNNPSVLGASSSAARSAPVVRTSGVGAPQPPAGQDLQRNDVQNQLDSGNDILERDYQARMEQLAGEEAGLRGQADVFGQEVSNTAGAQKTALGREKTTKESGLTSQEQTAKTQEKSALQQARDLFRQIQQENVAQLSASGLSSSSVAEALAERLGVETARRIAGVTGSAQEIYQNIAKERANINDYYAQRVTDLENEVATQRASIQQQLMAGLTQINSARNQAAVDKANGRQQLLTQAQTAMTQLAIQAQEFQQKLQQWKTANDNRLAQVGTDLPTLLSQLNSQVSNAGNPAGLTYGFTISGNPNTGNLGYQISATPKKQEEDLAF